VSTPVDRLYSECIGILNLLRQSKDELSLQSAAGDNLRKVLLLGAASYFETRMCATVIEFVREKATQSILVEEFVRNKAIARQYHTWFQWGQNNANQFFGLFGADFRAMMVSRIKASDELKNSIKAFLDIGEDRNQLVHQDYATFPLEKTLEEIYELYQKAMLFIETLPRALRDCDQALRSAITHDDIAVRAYLISQARGKSGTQPDPDADWYQAERELFGGA
jgi:RiboL-PSP-HEPN/Protein of unknown function (DUF2934)